MYEAVSWLLCGGKTYWSLRGLGLRPRLTSQKEDIAQMPAQSPCLTSVTLGWGVLQPSPAASVQCKPMARIRSTQLGHSAPFSLEPMSLGEFHKVA